MDTKSGTDELQASRVTQEEIDEGLQLLKGEAVVQFEKPSEQIIETESGYEVVESLGWIKFSTAFRERMLGLLKGAKLSIFISICLHLNENGESFPGIETISRETGYHRDTVMAEIKEMESIPNLMRVLRERGKVNHYRPAFVARGKGNQPVGKIRPVGRPVEESPTGLGGTSRGKSDSKKTEDKKTAAAKNIFQLYEENIGPLYPIMADKLADAEKEYSAQWVLDAFSEAVSHNKRNWAYVDTILKRWKLEGRGNSNGNKHKTVPNSIPEVKDVPVVDPEKVRIAKEKFHARLSSSQ